jgi:hypothetical protein
VRTTLTLDPDVTERLRHRMAEKKQSLKQVVNDALRAGLSGSGKERTVRFKVEPHAFGHAPGVDLDKLGQLADELEVEEFHRKWK